VVRIFAGRS